ncbi:MAG: pyridoxamine 5'-phosphate oxidase family protein [Pirellulaceae bacterium]
MGKTYDEITPELAEWLKAQHLFFVATAPLDTQGMVNCSPKGMDTFQVLGPRQVAYLDLTGSGVETIAHLRENGRIVLMFCALTGPPKIVRLHGQGTVVTPDLPDFAELRARFPQHVGERSVISVELTRIGDSCGFSIPRFEYIDERDTLVRWTEAKTAQELVEYRCQKNAVSVDGLPGLDPPK